MNLSLSAEVYLRTLLHEILDSSHPFSCLSKRVFSAIEESMIRLNLVTFCLFSVLFYVQAQPSSQDAENYSFQPNLGFVIGILGVMFVLTFVLLVYAKYCHNRSSVHVNNGVTHGGQIRSSSSSPILGIDKTVIESLPFFRFSTLKGSKQGLECAICLSKFEDIEILRLLPKCKHAFHINCIDHWLERHATCPLCRQGVSSEDLQLFTNSSSMRFLWSNLSELKQDSNIELFVQREEEEEEEHHQQQQQIHGSFRFSIGRSFRKMLKSDKEGEMLIQKDYDGDKNMKNLHRHNHKIIISDFVFMNRWSNVSSSDMMFLNKEMIDSISSGRFTSLETYLEESTLSRSVENEEPLRGFPSTSDCSARITSTEARRSVSEITGVTRFGGDVHMKFNRRIEMGESSELENNVKRQTWYPIARKTVQWFANREKTRQHRVETV
ncbi:E3 ubiquitin-protein ligase ATL42-like [Cucurbita moschata]|uniref:RING-type E3 ubiquitin transferase n=1 Tax=Cucurbita moschata TaxID=3662 RepID=A0A6J1EPJ8_CUCMO|nr:E3 ubiquitin-protein ligase ATL42-like [Cucurbita moschata]